MTDEKKYKGTILFVDDNFRDHSMFGLTYLAERGYSVFAFEDFDKAREKIDEILFDLAMIDLAAQGEAGYIEEGAWRTTGLDLIDEIRKRYPTKPIISMSAYPHTPKNANMRLDGFDFLSPDDEKTWSRYGVKNIAELVDKLIRESKDKSQ